MSLPVYWPEQQGELTQPITVQDNQSVPGEGGSRGAVKWVNIFEPLWCKFVAVRSSEIVRGDSRHDVRTGLFIFQRDELPTIKISMRFVMDGKPYFIEAIKDVVPLSLFIQVEGIYGITRE